MSRSLKVLLGLGLLLALGFGQVDTLWLRHHQYSPSYSHQYMKPSRTLAVDPEGNSHVCAYGQYISAGFDFIVLKYNPDGKLLWSTSYDGGGHDYAYAIAVDHAGGVYVTGTGGYPGRSVLTAKWDANGKQKWVREVRGNVSSEYNCGYSIAVDHDAVYIAGQVTNYSTGQDMALIKLDAATGDLKWTRTISRCGGHGYYEKANDVQVDGLGAVYIGGRTHHGSNGYDATIAKYDTDGNQTWEQNLHGGLGSDEYISRICLSGEFVVGTGYVDRSGAQDVLTVAYRSDGAHQWTEDYNGPGKGNDWGNDIGADESGNIFVCGSGSGNYGADMLVLKYRADGLLLWSELYDGLMDSDEAVCLDVDGWGSVVVGGRIAGRLVAGQLLAVLKYGSDGTLGWKFIFKPKVTVPTPLGPNHAEDVCFFKNDVIVAGITYWPYPDYGDPTVLKLREVPDVGVEAVLAPTGTVPSGVPVTPQADVHNYSLLPAGFNCRFEVTDGYEQDVFLSLGAGSSEIVDFPDWTPNLHGYWMARCYTELGLDYDRSNDTAQALVYVPGPAVDAGVRHIIKPDGNMAYQSSVIPTASFKNFGTLPADVWAFMFIYLGGTRLYADSILLAGLEPDGLDTVIEFRPWIANQAGYMVARCSTWMAGDGCAANDTLSFQFGVINEPVGNWTQLRDVPLLPSGRPGYHGGGLAADDTALYPLKGNKTNEVYAFNIAAGTWQSLDSIPTGPAGKPVRKGGAIAADDHGCLYVVRGNKTFEFYRFDPVLGWTGLSDVPTGPRRRKYPRGGTGLEHVVVNDTGYVYLLKGSNTAEFYRYNVVRDSWDSMPDAPAGTSGKPKYKHGSALAYDGDGTMYCLKGKYNEVFRFDVESNTWFPGQLPLVPLEGASGRRKKVKQGGDMIWANGVLAVLKGGNTNEFWRLEAADSSWYEFPEVPYGVARRKRVKYGGGLEFVKGSYYVLKGNKTQELWRFDLAGNSKKHGAMTEGLVMSPLRRLEVYPNPVRDWGVVRLEGGLAKLVRLTLYDACGRMRLAMTCDRSRGTAHLRADRLAPGVYFLVATDGRTHAGCKVVVAR